MGKKELFGRIIVIEIMLLIVGIVCLVPTAVVITRSDIFRAQAATATPQPQSVDALQTMVANLVQTQKAPLPINQKNAPLIPLTGTSATQTPASDSIQVTFIDVGKGDSILIQSPEGLYALIDGGASNGKALEYLQRHGVTRLALMIASVPHEEHIGGLTEILKVIPVDQVITNGQQSATLDYERFLDAIAASGSQFMIAKRGDVLSLGSLRMDVLHPGSVITGNIDVNSLVLRLGYEQTVFLFMGDANDVADQEILASVFPLRSTILKVGHHASEFSTSPGFLAAVRPKEAIFTPGSGDVSDQSVAGSIDALKAAGVDVYATDSSGTIIVLADKTGSILAQEKQAPLNPLPTAPPTSGLAFPVVVTGLTSPVRVGETASIGIETLPGAVCQNVMKFSDGLGGIANLGMKAADPSGLIRWGWRVGAKASAGNFTIDILCTRADRSAGGVIPFVVTP
jgi:competence protein ComEC